MNQPSTMLSVARLEALLARYPSLTIALVGDLFLDRYLWIDHELRELSIETGHEAYQVTRITNSPGALGTVMNNLAALGVGRLLPVCVLGDDGQAHDLVAALAGMPVDTEHLLRDPRRLTPTYTKPMRRDAGGEWRELNRLDLRNRAPLAADTEDRLIERISAAFAAADALIVTDQVNEDGWGVVTERVRRHINQLAREGSKPLFVDSRRRIAEFRDCALKPNVGECLAALGWPALDERPADDPLTVARDAASALAARCGARVLCTCGERGIAIADATGAIEHAQGFAVRGPVDTVGAGDSATAGIVSALAAGANLVEAATVGNLVASITVRQLGTTGTATPAQVIEALRSAAGGPEDAARM